jgi:hypothetical protein
MCASTASLGRQTVKIYLPRFTGEADASVQVMGKTAKAIGLDRLCS